MSAAVHRTKPGILEEWNDGMKRMLRVAGCGLKDVVIH